MNIYSFTHQVTAWLNQHPSALKLGKKKPSKPKNKKQGKSKLGKYLHKVKPPLMLGLTVVSITGVLGIRFYNQPKLGENAVAPREYKAPRYMSLVDQEKTEKLRKEARDASVPVLKKDETITEEIITNIQAYLTKISTLRESLGRLPYIDEEILSLESQIYLRKSSEEEWQSILNQVQGSEEKIKKNSNQEVNLQKEQISAKLKYHLKLQGDVEYKKLIEKIKLARIRYNKTQTELSEKNQEISININDENIQSFLALSDSSWQELEDMIRKSTSRILTQGIYQGTPEEIKESTINLNLGIGASDQKSTDNSKTEREEQAKLLAKSILLKFIQPNLIVDEVETTRRSERAAEAIQDQIIYIAKDAIIVSKGETITHEQFLWLDEFGLSRRRVNWKGIWVSGIISTGGVGILWMSQKKARLPFRCHDQILLTLLTLSPPVLAIFNFPYSNLPAVGLLTSTFYGPTVAVTQVAVSTGLVVLGDEFQKGEEWELLVVGAIGGTVAALVAGRLRDRDKLAQLGVGIGLTQMVVYVILKLILSVTPGLILWTALQQGLQFGLLSGLGWSVVALGISPYLERIFDLLTPSRLAELSNINQPLLKQLAEKTPGTWQHTLYVASLAEAAARKLDCNVELIRAGTLYHDIGKLHYPLGFIENQMGGENVHDQIDNPWESVEIIKKHVSEGLNMARRHELPKAIRDFIPQHQGTMLVAFFYSKAKKIAEIEGNPDLCNDSDFRYDGPIPQSREAGIMMLADSCEAALRSLQGATKEQALAMISKILKARWQDDQLIESGLKYEELPIIADVFVDVWQQSKHQRIPYPKDALDVKKKPLHSGNLK